MNISAQLAKHLREVHVGKNWTWSDMKEHLSDVTWEEATQKVHDFNTIAALVFHINYFIVAVMSVLKGQPLEAHDKYSFDHPPVEGPEDWNRMLEKTWSDAEAVALLIEQFPDEKLGDTFVQEKYGTYFRNLMGITEHAHYHLGQIVLIKKLIRSHQRPPQA